MLKVILDAIHELAFVNIGNKNAEISIKVSDLELLRLRILELEKENKRLKNDNETKTTKLDVIREQLNILDAKLTMRTTFDDYKKRYNR
jgi:hypothetical protein